VNNRDYRIYIEQKKRGSSTDMYIGRIYPSNSNWMSRIDDDRLVCSLSLPGTHKSSSASIKDPILLTANQTQLFSLSDQLEDGIRAFDLRLKKKLRYAQKSKACFDSTMVMWDRFLTEHPSECIIAFIGSDEGGRWDEEMKRDFRRVIGQYPHRVVEDFGLKTKLKDVRGKVLIVRRQEACPFGKLLKFTDNAVFDYDCFHVENVYKEHKSWKKLRLVEENIRNAFEDEEHEKWYVTFNNIAWSPRRHKPYSYAWGGRSVRKPLNKSLYEIIDLKDYTDFGIVFLDSYNDHGDNPQLVESIIQSNFHREDE
jgi:hypothetical protein